MSIQIRAVAAATLMAAGHFSAVAQPSAARPAGNASSAIPPAAAASGPAARRTELFYRSAFEGYRPYKDQPIQSWREANDLVGRIGGWQAYAREVQETEQPDAAPAQPTSQGQGSKIMAPADGKAAPTPPAAGSPGPSPVPVESPPASTRPQAPAAPASGAHSGHHKP